MGQVFFCEDFMNLDLFVGIFSIVFAIQLVQGVTLGYMFTLAAVAWAVVAVVRKVSG